MMTMLKPSRIRRMRAARAKMSRVEKNNLRCAAQPLAPAAPARYQGVNFKLRQQTTNVRPPTGNALDGLK